MRKFMLSLGILLSIVYSLLAQNDFGASYFEDLKVRLPASPNAASLGQFGDYDVSYYTGQVNISIPIYATQANNIGHSIALTYNASGNKPEELPSWVGLGWTLQAGGVVTRSARGNPDDYENYYPPHYSGFNDDWSNLNCIEEYQNYNLMTKKFVETQSDIYNLSAGDLSATFIITPGIINAPNKEDRPKVVTRSRTGLKIEPEFNPNGEIRAFKVTDPGGVIYYFGAVEISGISFDGEALSQLARLYYTFNSAWHLTEIRTPNGLGKITFEYDLLENSGTYNDVLINTEKYSSWSQGAGSTPTICPGDNPPSDLCNIAGKFNYSHFEALHIFRRQILKEITNTLTGENIEFISSFHNYHNNPLVDKQLDIIRINGQVDWVFEYSNATNRLTLESLKEQSVPEEQGGAVISKPPYLFNYNLSPKLPSSILTNAQDHWGYYNGQANTSLIPTVNGIGKGAIRDPFEHFMKAGILTDITYPTGGKTAFDFGAHVVKTGAYPYSNKIGGGLRVNSITNYNSDGQVLNSRLFRYTEETGSLSSGILFSDISDNNYLSTTYYNHHPVPALPSYPGNCPYQCERMTVSATANSPFHTVNGSLVGYSRVEVIYPGNGKSVYQYRNTNAVGSLDFNYFGKSNVYSDLINVAHFDENLTEPVQEIVNTYSSDLGLNASEGPDHVITYPVPKSEQDNKDKLCLEEQGWCGFILQHMSHPCSLVLYPVKTKFDQKSDLAYTLWHYLESSQTINHFFDEDGFPNGSLTTLERYKYQDAAAICDKPPGLGINEQPSLLTNPIETTTTNSDGKVHTTKNHYLCGDRSWWTAAENAAAIHLWNRNMPGVPLRIEKQVDGVPVASVWYEYDLYSGHLLTSKFHTLKKDGNWDSTGDWFLEAEFDYDGSGHPSQMNRPGWAAETYNWDKGRLTDKHYLLWHSQWDWESSNPNLLSSFTDVDGQAISYEYDELWRLKRTNARGGDVLTDYEYNYFDPIIGNPNTVTTTNTYADAPQRFTTQYFDGLGRLEQIIGNGYGPKGEDVTLDGAAYDGRGRTILEIYMPNTFSTLRYEQSPLDRLVKRTNPDGNYIKMEYGTNAHGEVSGYVAGTLFKQVIYDENDHPVTTFTDIIGQTILVKDAENNETRYYYDEYGLLSTVSSPAGVFGYTYNDRYLMASKNIPDAGTTTFEYNDKDLVELTIDAIGNSIFNTYDDYGQLLTIQANGQVVKEITYDINHIQTETTATLTTGGGSNPGNNFTEYVYDGHWRVVQQTINTPVGDDVIFTSYDAADNVLSNLRNHTGAHPIIVTDEFDYDHVGRMKRNWQRINSDPKLLLVEQDYSIRDELILKKLHSQNGGNTFLQRVNYGYNSMGWLTNINDVITPVIDGQIQSCTLPWGAAEQETEQQLDLQGILNILAEGGEPSLCGIEPCGSELCSYEVNYVCPGAPLLGKIVGYNGGSWTILVEYPYPFMPFSNTATIKQDIEANLTLMGYQYQEVIVTYDATTEALNISVTETDFPFYGAYTGEGCGALFVENCEEGCYEVPRIPLCTNQDLDDQNASIALILDAIVNINVSELGFPFTITLVQLCDGSTLWLPQNMLPLLAGGYNVLTNHTFSSPQDGCTVRTQPEKDLFKEKLNYYDDDTDLQALGQKNGNISTMKWQIGNRVIQAYGFQYDPINRLKNAYYKDYYYQPTNTGGGPGGSGLALASLYPDAYSVTNILYDGAGNIQSLPRNGWMDCQIGQIDQLTFNYSGNLLLSVTDGASANHGFKALSKTYAYDANGNMTENGDFDITYNYLNLPERISKDAANYMDFWYTADGKKLKKIVVENGVQSYAKDYANGIEYKDGALEAAYTSEGRIVLKDDPSQNESPYLYEYTMTDHLGNARVMFSDIDGNGCITFEDNPETPEEEAEEVLQENHYYPFGLNMEGPWVPQIGVGNRYQYNGKEIIGNFGLEWSDYGARWYDTGIGRWNGVDPLASKFPGISPFVYAMNSPVIFIDPDGRAAVNSKGDPIKRLWGVVRAIGGGLEMAGGSLLLATPEPTMVTKVGGYAALMHGADNVYTGLKQAWTGKEEISFTQAGLEAIGLTPQQAEITDMVIGLGLGGAGAIAKAEKMIKLGKITRGSYHEGLTALKNTADEMISNGYSYEEVVKQMSPARNNLKELVRASDDWLNKGIAEIRNIWKYGNKLGPSLDDIVKEYTKNGKTDWKGIYDKIWRTNETFDKLK